MDVRRVSAVVLTVVLITTAGCGFILGDESLAFSATPATVADAALDETGYEETNVSEQVVTKNFSVADQTRSVEVTNQLAQYERQVDLGLLGSKRAAVFVAFTSPEVSVLDQDFNPIKDMSTRDLLARFESTYSGIDVGEEVSSEERSVLGTTTTMAEYRGTATLEGQDVDVTILVTEPVKHGDDYVVTLAIYPQQIDDRENVERLIESLNHEE